MGTRHLIAAMIDGEYKIAQYGQFDGYPSGQGSVMLGFLSTMDRDQFAQRLRLCSFYTEQDITSMWRAAGASKEGLIEHSKAQAFGKAHPELSCDTSADILKLVAAAKDGMKLQNSIGFAGDSLFCEFAYVIDFDKGTFEAYKGFNKDALDPSERFANTPCDHAEYKQVKFVASWPLDKLPSVEEFINAFGPDEE